MEAEVTIVCVWRFDTSTQSSSAAEGMRPATICRAQKSRADDNKNVRCGSLKLSDKRRKSAAADAHVLPPEKQL
jgi:hypothetical protein